MTTAGGAGAGSAHCRVRARSASGSRGAAGISCFRRLQAKGCRDGLGSEDRQEAAGPAGASACRLPEAAVTTEENKATCALDSTGPGEPSVQSGTTAERVSWLRARGRHGAARPRHDQATGPHSATQTDADSAHSPQGWDKTRRHTHCRSLQAPQSVYTEQTHF